MFRSVSSRPLIWAIAMAVVVGASSLHAKPRSPDTRSPHTQSRPAATIRQAGARLAQALPDGDEETAQTLQLDPDKLPAAVKKIRRVPRRGDSGRGQGEDGGQAEQRFWRDISIGLPNVAFTAVAAHPTDPDIYFVGSDGFLFKTDDGGESWRAVLSFAGGVPDDGIVSNQGSFDNIVSNDAAVGLDRTQGVDFGDDITDDPANFDQDGNLDDVAALPNGDFDTATGVGEALFPRQAAGVREIAIIGEGVVYAATPRGLYRSIDGGESWRIILMPGGPDTSNIRSIAFDPRKPSVLFIGAADGLWLSPDGGITSWRAQGRVGNTPVLDIATERLGAETVTVVGTEQGLFRTWKTGEEFFQVLIEGEGPFDPVTAVAFDPRDAVTYAGTPNGVFAAERKSAVLELRATLSNVFATALLMNPRRLRSLAIGARDEGVVFATATGIERVPQVAPLQVLQVTGLARRADDPGGLIATTERGVFLRDVGTGMTVSRDVMRELRGRWDREPQLHEVATIAINTAGINPRLWDDAQTRARWAALLPQVRAQYRFFNGNYNVDIYVVDPEILFDPAVDSRDPRDLADLVATDAVIAPIRRGQQHVAVATATWQPERLLFNRDVLSLMRQRPLQQRIEQRVLETVQTAFTARRRLMAEIANGDGEVGTAVQIARIIRMQELTATLDGATGGAFSAISIERGVADPSAPLGPRAPAGGIVRKRSP